MKLFKEISRIFLALFFTVLSASALLLVKTQFDNKYTAPGPQAVDGTLFLSNMDIQTYPLMFLRDGWAFYQYQFLSPSDFSGTNPSPTTYLYLGEYGGLELGMLSASPHGVATYRMIIAVDGLLRSYSLEVPEIYQNYCIWINNALLRNKGIPSFPSTPWSSDSTVSFYAQNTIEIVVAVESISSIYSGMVYPPAFGLSSAVEHLVSLRLILASCFCAIALLTAIVFLCITFFTRKNLSSFLFALLCLCSILSVGRLLPRTFALTGDWLYSLTRLGYYGSISLILVIQGRFAYLPRLWRCCLTAIGFTMCVWVVIFPKFFMGNNLAAMHFFSANVGAFKWLSGALLFACGIYAIHKGLARRFLIGACIFACALILDRVYPLYEPILLLWPIESAIVFNTLLIFSQLVTDTIRIFHENIFSKEREKNLRLLAEARQEQYHQLAANIDAIRTIKHEMHSFLLRLDHYLRQKNYKLLSKNLENEIGQLTSPSTYTAHPLLDAILSQFAHIAQTHSITLVITSERLPETFCIDDADLTSLITNLLQNAIDAAAQISAIAERTINLNILRAGNYMKLQCTNARCNTLQIADQRFITTKANSMLHGIGLTQIEHITAKYHGTTKITYDDFSFTVNLMMLMF